MIDSKSGTVGESLRLSDVVNESVQRIADEVAAHAARITDVRDPDPAMKASYEAMMARASDVRGRALLYPYIGSGVGNGALVELADGSVKWDMICGIGVHFFGHSDRELAEAALLAGLDDTVKSGNLQSGLDPYELCEVVLAEARKGSRLRNAYLSTSGAMANENALKVCFQKRYLDQMRSCTGSDAVPVERLLARASATMRVLAFKDCFMGRSTTMAQIGDNHQGREGLPGGIGVDYMPFWDEIAAERMGGKKRFIDMGVWHLEQYIERYPGAHACFIFELIQGEGGFNIGDRDYFRALMDVCRRHRIGVWADEIQTFGRGTTMFAYEYFDLGEYIDVLTVGKMTQACMTLWTEDFNPKSGILSGTFIGEGQSFRVGKRIVERLRDGDWYGEHGRFSRHHALFREHCRALIARHPDWFPPVEALGGGGDRLMGGVGGMMRFTPFGGEKASVLKATRTLFDAGVILYYCGHSPYHLRMLPPLPAMKEGDWPRIFERIEKGLAAAAS